jgi:hypothetical protein
MVGNHAPGYTEQPQTVSRGSRQFVESPPGDHENQSEQVIRIGTPNPPPQIGRHCGRVSRVETVECPAHRARVTVSDQRTVTKGADHT